MRKVILQSHLPEFLWVEVCILRDQILDRGLCKTLGGDLRNDLILANFKMYFRTDRPICLPAGWAGRADVVAELTALLPQDKVKAEPVLTLKTSEIACIQLELR